MRGTETGEERKNTRRKGNRRRRGDEANARAGRWRIAPRNGHRKKGHFTHEIFNQSGHSSAHGDASVI